MTRLVITLPDSLEEMAVVRIGFIAHSVSSWFYLLSLGGPIDKSVEQAKAKDAGLLSSEMFRFSISHVGILQYWRSFEELESWSHSEPHAHWWKEAVERSRKKADFVVYHESYLVPKANFESIYLNLRPEDRVGATSFGESKEAIGPLTASRDRLGRR
jgi:hypothetical protein